MANEISSKHAKLLAEIIDQSAHWKLQPEKKPPFKSTKEAFDYIDQHNEPLYVSVPVSSQAENTLVKVTSVDDDLAFETLGFEDKQMAKVHHSHLKLIESTITELVNARLPDGEKAASF